MLLTLQLAALSNRPEVTLASALEASLHPASLVSLFAPNVFGSHAPNFGYWGPHYSILPEVGATDDSQNYLFIGAVPVVIMLWLGWVGGWLGARGRRALTLFLVLSMMFALGRYTPLFSLVFEYVPGFSYFRRPVDGTFLVGLASALICGHLLTDFVRRGRPAARPAAACRADHCRRLVGGVRGLGCWPQFSASRYAV